MRLEVSTRAKNDIELIFMYGIENFGQRQAAEYKDELLDLLDLMVLQPKMGVEKQSAKKPFRTMFFHNHLVFYRIGRGKVRIFRVLHGKQNWPNHL